MKRPIFSDRGQAYPIYPQLRHGAFEIVLAVFRIFSAAAHGRADTGFLFVGDTPLFRSRLVKRLAGKNIESCCANPQVAPIRA